MALFNRGGGAGGNMGKGTKPKGGWGAESPPVGKPGIANKQSSQPAEGMKPSGKHGTYGKPPSTKPMGGYGTHSGPSMAKGPMAAKLPSSYYKDRSGPAAPVPAGQGKGVNGIPNGKKP